MLRLDSLSLPLDFTPETLNALILRKLKCAPEQLKSVVLLKKAVDARDKADVHFVLSVAVTLKDEAKVLARLKPGVAAPFTFPKAPTLPKARFEHPPVVVGAGPAGLFAALTLARAGVQPILIERGKPVEERTKSVQMMQEQGILDPESNVQFGEGGAGENANSALLVGVRPEDFGDDHPLAGFVWQRSIEQAAFRLGGGGYKAPVQRVEDLLHDRATTRLGDVQPTYRPGVVPADLRACLPDFIIEDLKFGIRRMDGQLHGFAHPDALLTGVETRSSSPVRLPRNRETLMAERVDGLYPAGEGAGFAGGIVSAAVDGIQTALAALHHHAE